MTVACLLTAHRLPSHRSICRTGHVPPTPTPTPTQADPAEEHNRAEAEPAVVAALMKAMLDINATAVPAYVCGARGNSSGPDGALTPWDG